MREQPARRGYDNSGRAAQALATQREVVVAARDLLLERGYAATTIAAVARRAGVSAETVYKRIGGKAALVKRVYDVTLGGDDQPVQSADRPEILALVADPDPRGKVARYAAAARGSSQRLGPLLAVLSGARATDPELDGFAAQIGAERLTGARGFVDHLVAVGCLGVGLDPAKASDSVWALVAPELYLLLTGERGWTPDDYEAWLARTLAGALLDP